MSTVITKYHDSLFTRTPIYLPAVIPNDYPRENLPNCSLPMVKLDAFCPVCTSRLWGTFKVKKCEITNIACWQLDCMWRDENDAS